MKSHTQGACRALLVLAVVLVLAACGGVDESPTGDDPADGVEVTITGFRFDPEHVEVPASETVTWSNDDDVAHTATAGEPGEATELFDLELGAGSSVTITLDEPGRYAYHCRIHPTMTGQVTVSG